MMLAKKSVLQILSALALFLAFSPALAQPAAAPGSRSTRVARLLSEFSTVEYFWQQTEVARELIATGRKRVRRAIEPYLETDDRRRRCNAAFVLSGLGDERGTAILIAELEDTAPGSRALEEDPRWVGPLPTLTARAVQQVSSDRYHAALLLGELHAQAAVPALIAATRDESINYRAAISLGEIGDVSAIPALREMALTFPEQRVFAAYGLAALGATDGFAILEDVALWDEQWVQRRHAVQLLGKTMDRRAIPILLQTLKDEHANVRVATVRSLAEIGDPAVLPALKAVLDDREVTAVNAPTTTAAEAEKAIRVIESSAGSHDRSAANSKRR